MNNFIKWEKLEAKKDSGKEKVRCPNCDSVKRRTNDKPIAVDHKNGIAKCFRCESLSFRDNNHERNVKEYVLPKQDWKNYTNLSDKLVKFISDTRKIRQETLIHFGITEEKHYQPAKQRQLNNIVFNYFEGKKLVNKKYRSASKDFTQSKDGKPIFYNINSIIGENECYIVEGEFDVLALYEVGITNVISLPSGANDNDDYWNNSEPYLKDIERFIIGVDTDEKGLIMREKIAQRLGRYRCEFIDWKGKDANDDLISLDLANTVKQTKRFPVSGTFTVDDLYDDILNLYDNGLPDTIQPKDKTFQDLNKVFKLMRGHLVTGTGIPSHGKSNFTEWYVLNLLKDYDMKASFFSPEHSPMALHQANFIQKAVGKPFWKDMDGIPRITKSDIKRYKDWANEKLYITLPEGKEVATWDWMLEKFQEQMYSYGVDIFVVDAFNKVLLPKGMNKKDAIDEVLTKLTHFCQVNNVIMFLIAHPTKMQKDKQGNYEKPTLYDVSGSSDFRNQTHDGFCVYRDFGSDGQEGYTSITNLKTKMSFQGEIGQESSFNYHIPTGRYYARGYSVPTFDMTEDYHEVQEEITFEPKPMTPSKSFDEYGDFADGKEEAPF
jgi:twinkle protein